MAAALQAQYSELRAQQPMGGGRRSRSRVVYETLEIAKPAPEQQPPEHQQQSPPLQTPSQQLPQPALGQGAAAATKTDPPAELVPAADDNQPPDP